VQRVSTADAIVAAAREITQTVDIKAICCFTQSGKTAALVARERPRVPVLAMTPLVGVARRMCLTWGIVNVVIEEQHRFKGAVVSAARAARAGGYASEEDHIIVVAGVPFNVQGSTNILRVAPCAERLIYASDPE
jgi:pyruvate kinase